MRNIFFLLMLSGCSHFGTTNRSMVSAPSKEYPNGISIYEVSCSSDLNKCYGYSQNICGGPYYLASQIEYAYNTNHYKYTYSCQRMSENNFDDTIHYATEQNISDSSSEYSFGQKLLCSMRYMGKHGRTSENDLRDQIENQNDMLECLSKGMRARKNPGKCPGEYWVDCY